MGSSGPARSQHLFNGVEQAVVIGQHNAVELLTLGFVDLSALQCLQIEPDGGDRSFQLVRDGINERVVLFIPPDFPDQENGIQDQSSDDRQEDQYPQDQQRDRPPTEDNDPAYGLRDSQNAQADAERDEENDGLAMSAYTHIRGSLRPNTILTG